MIILLHSSKTMRTVPSEMSLRAPQLLKKAEQIASYLKTLSTTQLVKTMHLSPALAKKTLELIAEWNAEAKHQSNALDSFIGDIYSGLQAPSLSAADRDYADGVLGILSGLYGIIRPLDGIYPYRLEMGYKFPDAPFNNLYDFWSKSVAECLPKTGPIINLASDEFSDVITPFVDKERLIGPKFMTVNPKTGEPAFVVVHAKIARGAFAHWLIKTRTQDIAKLVGFDELGYRFDQKLSTEGIPTFICKEFGGKGLSMKTLKN